MSNIRIIAKKAGVSTATVSRFLNDPSKVSKEKHEIIQKVITEENYYTNGLISSFFKNKTNTIGVLIQDLNNPFFPQVADEISKYAQSNDYLLLLCNISNDTKTEQDYLKKLLEKRVDGLIVFNSTDPSMYKNVNIPIVSIEVKIPSSSYFESDNTDAGIQLANYINPKFKKLLILNGPKNLPAVKRRIASLVKNCTIEMDLVDFADTNVDLDVDFTKYDCIFCWNDITLYKIKQILTGLKIDDTFLIGFDNISINKYMNYNFVTVHQDMQKLGSEVIYTLIDLIEKKSPNRSQLIKTKIVEVNNI